MKKHILLFSAIIMASTLSLKAQDGSLLRFKDERDAFLVHSTSATATVHISDADWDGVKIAAASLLEDFGRVSGSNAVFSDEGKAKIVVGTVGRSDISEYLTPGEISSLEGKVEKYLMTARDGRLIIAGSDKRGTIYGIYSLSRQMGVSPWYWWADVPSDSHNCIYAVPGSMTEGEPAVRYRGIFLNDEAPCLTTWVKNTFGTDYGGHDFYAKVFELILRLKGNFMWPAMWGWAFYADDPLNSETADRMGVIMGTSHHEPMARNHQEWVRHRQEYGEWDYVTNKAVLDRFFTEGIRRVRCTEDLITIGMRGDGDTAMGAKEGHDDEYVPDDAATIRLLEKIVDNQRRIIRRETGRPAAERQQVWALYKEVQRYYDKGMKVPDDAIILLSDDNWGDIRRLPSPEELKSHKGGFGMYYHVDYVGAPRNSKWLNVTPIQHMWDQLALTWQYGVDKLWVLNVGDLKPMEYPISLFMDMAWNPERYTAANVTDHAVGFCAEQFGAPYAERAGRILNLYSKYAGRVTPEMLKCDTYNVNTGEWRLVADQMIRLEAEALRLYLEIPAGSRDAYRQLILFPVQALGNLYDMYYAQAMNLKLSSEGNPDANLWADRVAEDFRRDSLLCLSYNKDIAGGKWNGMMVQKHISYTDWNDWFPADVMPHTERVGNVGDGGYVFTPSGGVVNMDAEHYYRATPSSDAVWTVIPDMGRTRSAISLQPYDASASGASVSYCMDGIPAGMDSVDVHIITASTLAFQRAEGHRYTVGFDGCDRRTVNFNGELNEDPANVYRIMYPTVASRVIEKTVRVALPQGEGRKTLVVCPLDPGVVLEKIIVDLGGYEKEYLHSEESPCRRN